MALDVFIRPDIDGAQLWAAASGDRRWTVRRSGLRRRVAQLRYQNRATGVVFTVDEEADDLIDEMPALSGFNGRLNVARPDFYGREAVDAFAHLVSEVGGEVQILAGDAPDGPAGGESPSSRLLTVTDVELLDAWRDLNDAGWRVAERHAGDQISHTTREAADAFWEWQVGLERRRDELQDTCWLPELFWLRSSTTRQALRVAAWGEGAAQAIPDAELAMYLPPPLNAKTLPIMLEQGEVMAALGDLVATVRAVDGLEVRYVPESLDAECRGRIAALAAGREPFDQRLYEPADIDLLKAL